MRGFSTMTGLALWLSLGAIAANACDDGARQAAPLKLQLQMQRENAQAAGAPNGTSGRITGIVADPAALAVLSTDLAILDLGAPDCPPKVEISAIFTTSAAGKFEYLIGTSAGPNEHGVLEAKKVGNSYRAQAALTIAPIKSGTLKVHAIARGFPASEAAVSKVYACNGPQQLRAN